HGDTAACEATLALLAGIADISREARARDLSGKGLPAPPSSSGLFRGPADVGGSGRTEATAASMSVVTDRLVADPLDKPWDDGVEQSSLIGIANLRDDGVALGVALPFGH